MATDEAAASLLDDWEYAEDDDNFDDPCASCGPWCDYWLGDDLCELVIVSCAQQEEVG